MLGGTRYRVQKLPFGLYLKHGNRSYENGHANEYNALKLVRVYTRIPVLMPINHITTPNSSLLVTSSMPGDCVGVS